MILLFLPPLTVPIFGSQLTLYIGEVVLLVTIIISFFCLLLQRKLQINNPTKIFFFFFYTSFFSILNANDIGRFMIGFMVYAEVFFILLIFSNFKFNKKQSTNAIKFYLYSSIVLALFIIQKTLFENQGNFIIGQKIDLEIGGSNYLASILMLPLFIFYTMLVKGKITIKNIGLAFGFITIATSIIYTGSRASLFIVLALFLLLPVKDIFFSKQGVVKKLLSILGIMVLTSFIYEVGGNFLNQMIAQGRFSNLSSQSNLTSRFLIFREYFEAFLNHPIIGNGYNNVNALNRNFLAHNFVLQTLGDNGLMSTVLFLSFIISIFVFLHKKLKLIDNEKLKVFIIGYRRGLFAVVLHGLLEPNFGTKLFMLYIFLGLGIIMSSSKFNIEKEMH